MLRRRQRNSWRNRAAGVFQLQMCETCSRQHALRIL